MSTASTVDQFEEKRSWSMSTNIKLQSGRRRPVEKCSLVDVTRRKKETKKGTVFVFTTVFYIALPFVVLSAQMTAV